MKKYIEYYKNITKKNKFIGNQPVTFNKKNFIKKEYFLTKKLDGKRYLLMIYNDKIYRVSGKMEIEFLHELINNKINNTILDCEYFNSKYYVFDILFYNKKQITQENLEFRINLYKNLVKKINLDIIKYKSYYKLNDISKELPKFIEKYHKYFTKNKLDGLILTPNSDYYDKIYKYKPIELISIDFKIKKLKNYKFALLKQNGKVFNSNGVNGVIPVSKKDYELYNDNDIVEFVYKKDKFVPLRARPDKIKSNYDTVIKDNLEQILNPESIKEIVS